VVVLSLRVEFLGVSQRLMANYFVIYHGFYALGTSWRCMYCIGVCLLLQCLHVSFMASIGHYYKILS
jgi:hypothetical protein